MKYILTTLIGIVILSCGVTEYEVDENSNPYFPLDSFIQKEVKRLSQENPKVTKLVKYGNDSDRVEMDTVNFEQFFQPLKDCNIHKPNLIGSYSIDSVMNSDTLHLNYKAKSKKLMLKDLSIYLVENKVIRIESHEKKDGIFSSFDQKLRYVPDKGLYIEKYYTTTFTASTDINFSAEFNDH